VTVASSSKVAPVSGLPLCLPSSGQVCGMQ
jgi:hypothetical protein